MHYFMTHYLFLLYGALAAGAAYSVRRSPHVRWLGVALIIAWAISNLVHELMSFEWRIILFPMTDLMIAIVAQRVWRRTGYRVAAIVTVLSLLNCMVNVGYAWVDLSLPQGFDITGTRHAHTLATNLIFGSKCLILGLWGVGDALGWFDRLRSLPGGNRQAIREHLTSKGERE